jgi:hypothetical protein
LSCPKLIQQIQEVHRNVIFGDTVPGNPQQMRFGELDFPIGRSDSQQVSGVSSTPGPSNGSPDRDDKITLAFDAIRDLGPDAWPAVEELTRIVAEPFTPVRIGVDRDDVIASKLLSIRFRADAVDALTAIGEAAASSAASLIQWALTVRVIPMNLDSVKDNELFVDLITIDVLDRMRVAGAVARFGPDAAPAIVALLKSTDGEKRKLGVAILSENALPLAANLLKSRNCVDRRRGIAILADMWPVVAKEHLAELKAALVCDAD